MNTLSAFHAAQRGDTSSAYGGCGCGCNECGEYAGDYGSKYFMPGGFPDWNYSWYGRDDYLAGGCPDYEKQVQIYLDLAADYKALPRGLFGVKSTSDAKKDRIIEKAKKAKEKGKQALAACERLKKKGEGKYDETTAAIEAGRGAGAAPTSSASDEAFNAALQQVAAGSGGSTSEGGGIDTKTLLIIGGVAVVGLGALFVLRKKPAPKKKGAPSVLPGVV
jgi:hypothetical protein